MAQPYWWFKGESVIELFERLKSVGPDNAILKVSQDGNKILLDVIVGDGATVDVAGGVTGSINESHPCPPDCLA